MTSTGARIPACALSRAASATKFNFWKLRDMALEASTSFSTVLDMSA